MRACMRAESVRPRSLAVAAAAAPAATAGRLVVAGVTTAQVKASDGNADLSQRDRFCVKPLAICCLPLAHR